MCFERALCWDAVETGKLDNIESNTDLNQSTILSLNK